MSARSLFRGMLGVVSRLSIVTPFGKPPALITVSFGVLLDYDFAIQPIIAMCINDTLFNHVLAKELNAEDIGAFPDRKRAVAQIDSVLLE